MPLSTSLRDEENERINNLMKQLLALALLPDPDFGSVLGQLGLSARSIREFSSHKILTHLSKLHFDFANTETFADFLSSIGQKAKAVELYEYIQRESQTFSFAIMNKIKSCNDSLSL